MITKKTSALLSLAVAGVVALSACGANNSNNASNSSSASASASATPKVSASDGSVTVNNGDTSVTAGADGICWY